MSRSQRDGIEITLRAQGIRAVIYTRVSTEQQDDNSSIDTQTENGLHYALEHGYRVIHTAREVFTGSVYRERKELTKIRQMARNGEFEVLIINTYDRLSRNQTHFAVLIDEFEHLKIRVECVKEKLDDTPMGMFVRQTLSFVAEVERQKIMDRTEDGRKMRIQSGKMLTGNKPRYGYRWKNTSVGEKGDYAIDEDEAENVRLIFTHFTTVKSSCHGVTAMLNDKHIPTPRGNELWDRSVVYRILTDPFYIGNAYTRRFHAQALKPQSEWIAMPEGTIPAIIDEATFSKAQELLRINKEESSRNNKFEQSELLRCGFIKCGYCKRNMNVHRTLKRKKGREWVEAFYRCQYGHQRSIRCQSPSMIDTKRADDIVWNYVGELMKDFSLVETAIQYAKENVSHYSDVHSIERSIKNAQYNQDLLVQDLAQKENGIFKLRGRSRELVMNELELTEKHLEKLEADLVDAKSGQLEWERMQDELDKFIAWCLNGREQYHTSTLEEKRRVLRSLGLVMYVYRRDDLEHEPYEIQVAIPGLSEIALQSF